MNALLVGLENFLKEISQFMNDGGIFMWVIFFMWSIGMGLVLERFVTLTLLDTNGRSLMNHIKKKLLSGDIQEAIKLCSRRSAALPNILKQGLLRCGKRPELIQSALESKTLEAIPRVERRLNYISLFANISTLLGLLGTIYGLIRSFSAVAQADPAQKAEMLANGIAVAMNTTAFGLISAISLMFFHAILAGKSDGIIASIEEYSLKLYDLLVTFRTPSPSGKK